MIMVGDVQVYLGFLIINCLIRATGKHQVNIPPAQTLRRVVISTRCSVASRDPSSRV
jgi:hypothetical protein